MSEQLACTDEVPSSRIPPTLLERIRALDRSAELRERYTALVLFHPTISSVGDASSYVAVGHAETSFIDSVLIHCTDDAGEPIFAKDRIPNKAAGVLTEVLRLCMDVQLERDVNNPQERGDGTSTCTKAKLFEDRTAAFEHATNHLLSSGVISYKHSDLYPICPFDGSNDAPVLAHVNRSTAPYLGIDSVGVHLHCYVSKQKDTHEGTRSGIVGVWLAKRAPTKSHHPNFWDPTVAGGQPACLSLLDNIVKEAHEEAGVPAEWIQSESSDATTASDTKLSDHTHDPLTITTAKPDGSCMKRSMYYSADLQVPPDWTPTAVDGEVSEFKLYSIEELEQELRFGNSVRPAMRAVLLDFMMRHNALKGEDDNGELRDAMRRERLTLW
ncbi:hypothetical protein ACHAXT_010273 [Thalassiosira profunda]